MYWYLEVLTNYAGFKNRARRHADVEAAEVGP
jgi:hypothetical protein